jgi:hypothetical protein
MTTVRLVKDLDARRFVQFPSGMHCHEGAATPFPTRDAAYEAIWKQGLNPARCCITSRLRAVAG